MLSSFAKIFVTGNYYQLECSGKRVMISGYEIELSPDFTGGVLLGVDINICLA